MRNANKTPNKRLGITFFVSLFLECLTFLFVEFPVAPEISQPPKNATKVEGQDVVFSEYDVFFVSDTGILG